ncbi:tRNA (adenosine(37)-N6)-threonylcarbamoyltransferase complex ATPase subunit type 1 TsaE [Gilvibacter sp.]|uniref:tRNA (adenosine(37)-N6)-threonylcarbamoyltransferase complex ATPase subunit type 1 TsaE n=1 Tax=Gilvibacter sp. TaxID=2729997 RepID=UPI003F4A0C52
MTGFTYKLEEVDAIAEALHCNLEGRIVLLYGELGVGKTTLLKALLKKLGVQDQISSPTYALVHEYSSKNGPIFHFDCYRLKSSEDAEMLGFTEYLDSGNWVFIEWPEKVEFLLDQTYNILRLSRNADNTRTLNLKIERTIARPT